MPIQVEVWGDYACFTRPEMKTERVSYDVMTPSAARGMIEAVYWHEGLTFLTDPTFTARFWTSTPRLRGMQFAYGDSASADDPTKAVLLSIYDDASTLNMQSYSIVPSVENHMYPIRCVMDPM